MGMVVPVFTYHAVVVWVLQRKRTNVYAHTYTHNITYNFLYSIYLLYIMYNIFYLLID